VTKTVVEDIQPPSGNPHNGGAGIVCGELDGKVVCGCGFVRTKVKHRNGFV
jgi:hypothetical protein